MGRSVGVCSEPVQDEDVVGIRIQCNYRFSSDISLYALLFFPRPALLRLVLSLQSIHYILHVYLSYLVCSFKTKIGDAGPLHFKRHSGTNTNWQYLVIYSPEHVYRVRSCVSFRNPLPPLFSLLTPSNIAQTLLISKS